MKTADKGTRLGNLLIDFFVFFILAMFHLTPLFTIFPTLDDNSTFFNVYFSFLYFSYYFFFEYTLGRTPGKYITQTMVVTFNGNKPSLKSIVIRSICRLIPYDSFSYIFGFTGLHDTISRTTVVYK